jgi:ankyrin repeat protein
MYSHKKILLLAILAIFPVLSACEMSTKPQPPSPMSATVNDNDLQLTGFIKDGWDVNAKNEYGQTLLHVASMEGSIKVARLLIRKGANLEAKDNNGDTPIYHAAGTGREKVVALLIESGANLNVVGKYGSCPLTVAIAEKYTKITELLRAAGARECR